jgi:hypothetical protein
MAAFCETATAKENNFYSTYPYINCKRLVREIANKKKSKDGIRQDFKNGTFPTIATL